MRSLVGFDGITITKPEFALPFIQTGSFQGARLLRSWPDVIRKI